MTSKELKWVDAAIIVLSDSPVVWMTAPELVREIQRKEIRPIKNNYGQAVRTLRAALNGSSKKPYGLFCRSDGDINVSFALRTRVDSASGPCKLPSNSRRRNTSLKATLESPPPGDQLWVPMSNGLPPSSPPISCHIPSANSSMPIPHSSPTHFPAAIQSPPLPGNTPLSPLLSYSRNRTATVEIDPSVKPSRTSRLPSDVVSHMCLPSPLTSILGPSKTLQVLSESSVAETLRPVRQVRKRHLSKEADEDLPPSPSPLPYGCVVEEFSPAQTAISPDNMLLVETCHVLLSELFDVVCVRPPPQDTPTTTSSSSSLSSPILASFDDPCHAQGMRSHSGIFELEQEGVPSKKVRIQEGDSGAESQETISSDSDSESELSDLQIQPRPSSRLLMSRRLSQQRQRAPLIDYGLLSESMNEDSEDIDVEYVDPTYSRSRVSGKKANRSKGQNTDVAAAQEGKKPTDQKRNINSLFQPQSPLISENMKSLLNMEAFMGLTEAQRSKLVKLLPAVDRAGPSAITSDCLNNSFFSSALREWVEQVANGCFTTEYRARVRADEKRKAALKADDAWKRKFFEEKWGDNCVDGPGSTPKPPGSTPFYPHPKLSGVSAQCLEIILKKYHGKKDNPSKDRNTVPPSVHKPSHSQATHPSVSATLPPSSAGVPPLPDSSPSKAVSATPTVIPTKTVPHSSPKRPTPQPKKTARSLKASSAVKKKAEVLAKPASSHSPAQSLKKNHIARKVAPKFSLPSLLNKSSRVSKATSKRASTMLTVPRNSMDSKLKTSKVIEQLKLNSHHAARLSNPGQFLTLLPPRTPYQTLLVALSQASKGSIALPSNDDVSSPSSSSVSPPPEQQCSATTRHTHSVFHDHFALLKNRHIPSEFSPPVTSLALQLPIDIYASCVRARVTREEHSYAKAPELCRKDDANSQQLNLKLSLPRSLLQSNETASPCGCDRGALVFCSSCRSLYHSTCSSGTLCTNCITLRSLNLS